jgi:hypothetical protein
MAASLIPNNCQWLKTNSKQLKKLLFILFLLIYSGKICIAQDISWASHIGGKKYDQCLQTVRTQNGYILPIYFRDSFFAFGNWFSAKSITSGNSLYLCFYDFNGKLKRIIRPKVNDSVSIGKVNPEANDKITFNSNISIARGTYIDGKQYNQDSAQWLLELDTQGVYHRILEISCKYKNQTVFANVTVGSCQWINNHYYISLRLGGPGYTYYFGNDSVLVNSQSTILGIVLNTNKKVLNKYQINTLSFPTPFVKSGNEILLPFEFQNPNDTIVWNNLKYPYKKDSSVVIFTLDTLLNFKQINRYFGHNLYFAYSPFGGVHDQKFYYSSNLFIENNQETIIWQNAPHTLYYGYNPIISYISNSRSKFQKLVTKQFGNSTGTSASLVNLSVTTKNEFAYISGQSASPTIIYPDSLLINSKVQDPDFFLMKLDTFGNILWYLNFGKKGSSEYANPVIIEDDGVVVSGTFDSTTTLGNYTLTSNGGTDALLFKISDNSIYRGNIYKGPYCAGDSIEVPYRAYGKFADTNTFFAELSDENGNFYGTPRQLGSLKTNALQGAIRGVLPLFDVVSSGKYRIRIRSNSPFVQSFMRYDSLYLLIYSKDKANPGADTTICVGDNLQLKTTGGTRWLWSPGTAVRDSTARITQFIGTQNTRMRIAISDSSGCGAPDTAWKYIAIYPKLAVTVRDTVVCRSTQFYMTAKLDGGRPSSRSIYWYSGTTFLGKDTLKSSTWLDTSYMAVARDGCPLNTDTSWVQVTLPNPPVISINDTTVCKGELLTWKSSIVGFKGMPVQLTWYRGNTKLSDSVLVLKVDSNEVLWLHGDDYCAAAENRKELQISIFDKPIVTGAVDSFCAKAGHTLAFTTLQGKEPFTYWLNNQQVSNPAYAPAKPLQWLQWYAQDACGQKTELDSVLVNQKPVGSIIAAPKKGCAPLLVNFKSNIVGATWYLESSIVQGQDSFSYVYTNAGVYTARMVVNNAGCKDSVSKQIEVYEAPTAAFEIQQHELLIGEARTRVLNTSGPAKRYIWYWKDSMRESSSLDVWVLDLQDTGMSKVWMIAESIHGCRDTFIDSVQVHPRPILWIPTAITLNGDGLNDALAAGGIGLKSYRFMVFNRWGEMVFSGKENEEWRPSSTVLPGMYVYRCIYSNWKGTKFEQNGTVMLLR